MRATLMASVLLATCLSSASVVAGSSEHFSVALQSAPRRLFPGVVHGDMDPNAPGDIDCSSPAHWEGPTLYMFYSTGHPFRSSGPSLFHLERPAQRVRFDNEAGWTQGGRWIESTHKAEDGRLYMWYHNEPPLVPDRTAPRIGTMVSTDDGLTWRDLGFVLEAPAGSNNPDSANKSEVPTDNSQKQRSLHLTRGIGGMVFPEIDASRDKMET